MTKQSPYFISGYVRWRDVLIWDSGGRRDPANGFPSVVAGQKSAEGKKQAEGAEDPALVSARQYFLQ